MKNIKRTVDRTKLIEFENDRNIAKCKRRKGLLNKAIELSRMCNQQILLVVFDPATDKVVKLQSSEDFTFGQAYKALYRARKAKLPSQLDCYTNDDYDIL